MVAYMITPIITLKIYPAGRRWKYPSEKRGMVFDLKKQQNQSQINNIKNHLNSLGYAIGQGAI